MRKKIIAITSLSLFAVLTTGIMVQLGKPIPHKYLFVRKFKNPAVVQKFQDINFDRVVTRICGSVNGKYYLATNTPDTIIIINTENFAMQAKRLYFPPLSNLRLRNKIIKSFHIQVDTFGLIVYAGNVPAIFTGTWNNDTLVGQPVFTQLFSTNSVCFSPGSYIIRNYVPKLRDFTFAKVNNSGKITHTEQGISITIPDDGISSGGFLHYDKRFNHLLYINSFCNKITCFDTNLRLVYRAKTIDPVDVPVIASAEFHKNGQKRVAYASAPAYVNLRSCLYDGKLYVLSAARSINDSIPNYQVVDVYDSETGSYDHSFYIPVGTKDRINSFAVSGNLVLAISDRGKKLSTYLYR